MNDGAREQPLLHNNADRIAAQHTKRIEMIEAAGKAWVRSAIFFSLRPLRTKRLFLIDGSLYYPA